MAFVKLNEDVNIEQIKLKLYEKLKPSGWGDKLRGFILSKDFDTILESLLEEAKEGRRFTPPVRTMFRAFEECDYNKLKVIIIGQDPYPKTNIADGIAFSCSQSGTEQPSLKYLFNAIRDTVYPKQDYDRDVNLARYSNQGILMLNAALTTTINKVGQHYILWRPFMAYLLDIVTCYNPGLVYVFMGAVAKQWADSIPDNNYKLFTTHPASAAHNELEHWDCDDVFNKVNGILTKTNRDSIIW